MKNLVTALVGLALMWGVHPEGEPHDDLGVQPVPIELQIVNQLTDAFNAHDANAIAALSGEKVEWLNVRGRKLSVSASGRGEITREMTRFFAGRTGARCVVEDAIVSGTSVAVRRRIFWQDGSSVKSEASLVVYQVKNGKVRRAWFYPTEK